MERYREEFPDFDYDLPTIEGFEDISWHNDVCPSMTNAFSTAPIGEDKGKLTLWCDYADTSKREFQGGPRFRLVELDSRGDALKDICESDELAAILAAIASHKPR